MTGLVDEIRLHPPRECWETILSQTSSDLHQRAKEIGFDIGIEVPSLPGLELLIPALPFLDFLNVNELEWGETNACQMRERGYEFADGLPPMPLTERRAGQWSSAGTGRCTGAHPRLRIRCSEGAAETGSG